MKSREALVQVNAESIKRALQTTGLTQVETSRLLGLKENYMSATLATGKLPQSVVERLAIFLRVPVETLYLPEEKEQPKAPEDAAKESTLQALILAVKQLTDTVTIMSDEISAMKTQDKNYYVATTKTLEKLFNQVRYDPTKVK